MEDKIMDKVHQDIEKNQARTEKSYRRGYEQILDKPAHYVTKLAHAVGFNRASLTYFWVVIQFVSTLLFIPGDYLLSVIGIIIFQFMFIVDLADGKLARLHEKLTARKLKKPLLFKYVDRVGHYINDPLLFVFLGYGSMRFGMLYFYIGITAGLLFVFSKVININPAWYTSRQEQGDILGMANTVHIRSKKTKLKQFLFDILRVEHMFSIVFVGIVLNVPHYTLVLYALVYLLEFLRKLYAQWKHLYHLDKRYQEILDKGYELKKESTKSSNT
jgi:hypothetical protein